MKASHLLIDHNFNIISHDSTWVDLFPDSSNISLNYDYPGALKLILSNDEIFFRIHTILKELSKSDNGNYRITAELPLSNNLILRYIDFAKLGNGQISAFHRFSPNKIITGISILNSILDPCAILDQNGNFVYNNKYLSEIINESDLSKNFFEIAPEIFSENILLKSLFDIFNTQRPLDFRAEIRNQKKQTSLYHVHLMPIISNHLEDAETFILLRFENITKQTFRELALKESEAKYRAIVEGIPGVIYLAYLDPCRSLSFVSPRASTLLGVSDIDLQNNPDILYDIVHPDDKNQVIMSRTKPDAKSYRIEYRILHKDGKIKWIRDEASIIYDPEDNQPVLFQGLIFDITDIMEAEEALRKSESRFRNLVQNIHEYIYSFNYSEDEDPQSYHSSKAYNLTGHKPEDFYKNHDLWNSIIYEKDKKGVNDFFTQLKVKGGVASIDHRIVRKDGEVRWVSNTCAALLDNNNQLLRLDGFILDTTDQKTLELDLKEAFKAAETANELKSRFLANMSHDIRTPMHGVLGMTEILLKTDLNIIQKQYLEMIRTSGETLLNLLNDILDFTKIEAGKITFSSHEFNLEQTMKAILGPIHVQANDRFIEFSMKLDPEVPVHLLGDSHRFSQILNNLAGNAANYTESGKILVVVSLDRNESLNEYHDPRTVFIHFVVADTGIGIPQNKINTIFDSFNRLDGIEFMKPGGSGLGTTIAKQLVELMGGTIGVTSPCTIIQSDTGGPGSEFYFTLPFINLSGSRLSEKIKNNKENENETSVPLEQRMRILVAEDNEVNQLIIRKMLEKIGHEVSIVSDGKQAVEAAEENTYDIILMDLQMPVMNGFKATELIRKSLGNNIPIFAVTADAYKDDLKKCSEAGMNGFLIKPYKLEDLINLINSAKSDPE